MGACYQTCNLVHVARELKFWVFGTKFVQNILNFAGKPFKKRMVNKGMKTVKAILYVKKLKRIKEICLKSEKHTVASTRLAKIGLIME